MPFNAYYIIRVRAVSALAYIYEYIFACAAFAWIDGLRIPLTLSDNFFHVGHAIVIDLDELFWK